MVNHSKPTLNLLVMGSNGAVTSELMRRLSDDVGEEGSNDQRYYTAIDFSAAPQGVTQEIMQGTIVADGAVLAVDASDDEIEPLVNIALLLWNMSINQIIVALNKTDLPDGLPHLKEMKERVKQIMLQAGLKCLAVVPLSVRTDGNLRNIEGSDLKNVGPTLLEALNRFQAPTSLEKQPLRLPLNSCSDRKGSRFYEGRLRSGLLVEGEKVLLSPSNTVTRVTRIQILEGEKYVQIAHPNDQVSVLLDADLHIQAGELLSHVEDAPIETDVFRGRVLWQRKNPLTVRSKVNLNVGGALMRAEIQSISHNVDATNLTKGSSSNLMDGQVGGLVLRSDKLLAIDTRETCPANSGLEIIDQQGVAGVGSISMDGYADQRGVVTVRATNVTRVAHQVSIEARANRNEHRGAVLWFTGLSGAGKSTLAVEVERAMFEKGYAVYVLDGDNIRHGLNADLGFSPEDRAENIRRVGEVAALFSRAGVVAISAFISPYRSDRDRARVAAGSDFHEIYIKAPIEVCEERDPKGLYARARSGELREFTGISAPYEMPESPDLIVDTANHDVSACVAHVVAYVDSVLSISPDRPSLITSAGNSGNTGDTDRT